MNMLCVQNVGFFSFNACGTCNKHWVLKLTESVGVNCTTKEAFVVM